MSAIAVSERRTTPAEPAIPDDLASPKSKLVYLYLDAADGGTVNELHSSLGIKRIELYPVLKSLTARDIIERDGETYRLLG